MTSTNGHDIVLAETIHVGCTSHVLVHVHMAGIFLGLINNLRQYISSHVPRGRCDAAWKLCCCETVTDALRISDAMLA